MTVLHARGWSGMHGGALRPSEAAPWDVRLMHRALRALLWLAGLTWLTVGMAWLLRQGGFDIHRIGLEGELNRSSVATIRANALPRLQGNFFTIDLQAARRAFESVPWVRHAEVQRHWPGSLRVRLEEHRAVALWEPIDERERRDDRLVGRDGTVFQANPGDVEDEPLPVFRGPQGQSELMWHTYGLLAPVLSPIGTIVGGQAPAVIRALDLTTKGSWSVELDSGARIEIGRGSSEDLVARCESFVRTLPQALAPFRRPLLLADLRHAQGYALRLAGITTTVMAPARPAPAPRTARTQP